MCEENHTQAGRFYVFYVKLGTKHAYLNSNDLKTYSEHRPNIYDNQHIAGHSHEDKCLYLRLKRTFTYSRMYI